MARQPIENLQGFGQTSVSSARPIDAFTGAPAIPQETPGSQLANALGAFTGSVARASARNAAQAKNDQEKITAEKMQSYGAEIVAQGEEFGGQDELAAEFPSASTLQKITLAETIGKNRYTQKATERLTSWLAEDSNLLIDGGYNDFKATLLAEFEEETGEHEFLKSGMYQGVNDVFNQYLSNYHSASNLKVKDTWAKEYQATIFHIASNATSPEQMAALIQLEDDKMHPYKKDAAKIRELTVGNLISYDIVSGKTPITKQVMDSLPWLRSKESETQVALAQPKITSALVTRMTNKAATKKRKQEQQFEAGEMFINKIALGFDEDTGEVNPDITFEAKLNELEKRRSELLTAKPEDAEVANNLIDVIDNTIDSLGIDKVVSSERVETLENDLVVDASIGEINNLSEMQKAIREAKGLTVEDKGKLQAKAADLLNGSKLLTDSYLNKAYNDRTSSLDSMLSGRQASLSNFSFIKSSGGIDLESYFKDTFFKRAKSMVMAELKMNGEAPGDVLLQTKYREDGDGGIFGIALKEAREAFAFALENKKMMEEENKPQTNNQESGQFGEGQTATNAAGQKIIFEEGEWKLLPQ